MRDTSVSGEGNRPISMSAPFALTSVAVPASSISRPFGSRHCTSKGIERIKRLLARFSCPKCSVIRQIAVRLTDRTSPISRQYIKEEGISAVNYSNKTVTLRYVSKDASRSKAYDAFLRVGAGFSSLFHMLRICSILASSTKHWLSSVHTGVLCTIRAAPAISDSVLPVEVFGNITAKLNL